MRGKLIVPFLLAASLSGTAAHAGLIGEKVHGEIAYPPEFGESPDEFNWGTTAIRHGLEFEVDNDAHRYKANFKYNRLVIMDREQPHETSTGWRMTFAFLDPEVLKNVSLRKNKFGDSLTYTINKGVLTVNWTGDAAYAAMTREERRELGPQKFRAIFRFKTDDGPPVDVPEPGTLALFGTAMLAAFAFAFGRRRTGAPQSSRLIG